MMMSRVTAFCFEDRATALPPSANSCLLSGRISFASDVAGAECLCCYGDSALCSCTRYGHSLIEKQDESCRVDEWEGAGPQDAVSGVVVDVRTGPVAWTTMSGAELRLML